MQLGQKGICRIYLWNNKKYNINELAAMSGLLTPRGMYERLKKNDFIVTRDILFKKQKIERRYANDNDVSIHCGVTINKIHETTYLSISKIQEMIRDGQTANQILYGKFGDIEGGKSLLDAWKIAFNALPINSGGYSESCLSDLSLQSA